MVRLIVLNLSTSLPGALRLEMVNRDEGYIEHRITFGTHTVADLSLSCQLCQIGLFPDNM